ncbi:uncharacterized protein LOC106129757 [Amyelois transitella]|uniref:uncharacterized protein LOC106129757 n=1 Tax=Amyelois transitella TaxID=680683 RepID=UPI00067C9857|nr:uncharacterized protein LOC106129757 [Amyelois transitella]
MTEYYNVVPWYNSNEWHNVYNKIYNEDSKQEAHNMLMIWKARCPSLPSGIESTLTLLEVHLQDLNNFDDITKDHFLRLAYSSAIMRFVNHMLDTETAKGSSLYHAAKNLGVPDWIIDMRHNTAHSNNLPSLDLLREASVIGLKWLQKNYWDKYKECIQDYTTSEFTSGDVNGDKTKLTALLNFCLSLSVCMHSKIKKLSDISDIVMRESIVNDTRDLFGDQIDLSNLKTVSIMSLVNLMNHQSKKLLQGKNKATIVTKTLLGEDSLFLSSELVHYLSDHDFTRRRRLNRDYMQCFELLLVFLHSNDLIFEFVMELVHITQEHDDKERCLLAAIWLSEILKALKKSKEFINKMNRINSNDMRSRKRKELISLYHHWFPNDKANGLLLDLLKSAPNALLNINFVQTIISAYNPFLAYFVVDLLNLVEPHLPKLVKDKVCKLAHMISSPERLQTPNSNSAKIYTVQDLECFNSDVLNTPMEVEDTEPEWRNNEDVHVAIHSIPGTRGLWNISTLDCDWSVCPIGCLVQQNLKN